MNKSKILVVLIVLLLLANAVLLFLYLNKNRHAKRGAGRRMHFKEELKRATGFSDSQMVRFENTREGQRRNMEPLFDSITRLRGIIFEKVTGGGSDSAIAPDIARLSSIQGKIDLQMLQNFREARSICLLEQLPKFDSAMKRMMIFSGGRKKGPPTMNKPQR
jgi:periplasmic protein CpxP/Spy